MNQKISNASELKALKAKLQAKRKSLLKRFYEESSRNIINSTESLIARIDSVDVKKIRKE